MLHNAYDNPIGSKVYTKINESEFSTIMDTTTICVVKEVKSYKEVNDITSHYICETEDGKIREVRDWEVIAVPDYTLPIDKMIYRYLMDNGVYADVWTSGNEIAVHIDWGDWKHDFLWTRDLMGYLGYNKVEENVTEEDGSDTYSATQIYEKSEMMRAYLKKSIALYKNNNR